MNTSPISSGRPDDDGDGRGDDAPGREPDEPGAPPAPEPRSADRDAHGLPEPLDFDSYQERALETALFPEIGGERAVYPALGLADEAGEVLGKIKKLYRDRGGEVTPEFRRDLARELGDVYWYLAVLADAFDLRSSEIAAGNLRKLADRADRGVIQGEGDDR